MMLRSSAAAAAALRRHPSASAPLRRPIPSRPISTVPIPVPRRRRAPPAHRRDPIPRRLLPASLLSRGYARMLRRIPPARPRPEMESSESDAEEEKEDEVEKCGMGVEAEDDEDEGPEGWEGFMLDFGAGEEEEEEEEEGEGEES